MKQVRATIVEKDIGKGIPKTFIRDAGRKKRKTAQAIRRAILRVE